MNIKLNKNRLRKKNLYFEEWKKSTFFLALAFANYFLPFFICLMAGVNKEPQEPEYVIGIGFSTGYMVNIFQVGAILCMTLSFGMIIYSKQKKFQPLNNNEVMTLQLMIICVIGIILIPLYIGFGYMYMYFGGAFSDTRQAICNYGLKFLLSSSPSMLLMAINIFFIYVIFFKKQKNLKSIILVFINLIINCFCTGMIGYFVGQNTLSYGYGLIVGNCVCILFNLLILWKCNLLWKFKFSLKIKSFLKGLNFVWGFTLDNLFITFLRSFVLLIAGLSLKVNSQETPWNYLLGKVIWYNAIYLLLFINSGTSQQISYIAIKNYDNTPKLYNDANKIFYYLPLFCLITSLIVVISFNFLIDPIARLYASNSNSDILDGPQDYTKIFATGVGSITYFVGFPYSKTYLYTAIFIVLTTTSTGFSFNSPIKIIKTKKEMIIGRFFTMLMALAVLGFIAGMGVGLINNPLFPFMEGFGFSMMCAGVVFVILNLLSYLKNLKKNKNLWNNDINRI